jgi:hypothetical protein
VTRLAPYILVFATGVATALAMVSCGSSNSDNLLPGDTASEIVANLDQVKQLSADGKCAEAETAVDEVRLQVTELPSSVDPKLRRALQGGVEQLQSVTADCVETTVDTFDTFTTPTDESTTESKATTKETTKSTPTTTESQPTTTTTAPTTTTPTPPTTTTTPPTTGGGSGGVGPGKAKRGR